MKPVSFPEQTVVIAKDQPQYLPLPAHVKPHDKYDPSCRMTFCWQLSWRERLTLLVTGRLWHQVLTFNSPLQPQLLLVKKPDLAAPPAKQPSGGAE